MFTRSKCKKFSSLFSTKMWKIKLTDHESSNRRCAESHAMSVSHTARYMGKSAFVFIFSVLVFRRLSITLFHSEEILLLFFFSFHIEKSDCVSRRTILNHRIQCITLFTHVRARERWKRRWRRRRGRRGWSRVEEKKKEEQTYLWSCQFI